MILAVTLRAAIRVTRSIRQEGLDAAVDQLLGSSKLVVAHGP
jgi:hypothetical protein